MSQRVTEFPQPLPAATPAVAARSPDAVRLAFQRLWGDPSASTVARVVIGYEPSVLNAAAAQEGALIGAERSLPSAEGERSHRLLRYLGLAASNAASFVARWLDVPVGTSVRAASLSALAA